MLDLSPEQVMELPVDQLGLAVLSDLIETDEWNESSYLSFVDDHYKTTKVRLPIMEALAWLRARGLTMPDVRQATAQAITVTRLGRQVHREGPRVFSATQRLQTGLHPLVEEVARPQFLIGQYELAVVAAMKKVEIRVRALGRFTDADFGVSLMNKAFGKSGPLTDPDQVSGEQEGTRALFAGTYAVFRNPTSHREVNFDDVTEAAEMVQIASLLMRILDRVEGRIT